MEAWILTSAATRVPIPGAGAEDVEQVATLAVEDDVLEPDTPLFLSFAFFASFRRHSADQYVDDGFAPSITETSTL